MFVLTPSKLRIDSIDDCTGLVGTEQNCAMFATLGHPWAPFRPAVFEPPSVSLSFLTATITSCSVSKLNLAASLPNFSLHLCWFQTRLAPRKMSQSHKRCADPFEWDLSRDIEMQKSDSTRMGWGGEFPDHPTAAVSGHKNPEMGLILDKLLQDLLWSSFWQVANPARQANLKSGDQWAMLSNVPWEK